MLQRVDTETETQNQYAIQLKLRLETQNQYDIQLDRHYDGILGRHTQKALKLIAACKLTFGERFVLRRVDTENETRNQYDIQLKLKPETPK